MENPYQPPTDSGDDVLEEQVASEPVRFAGGFTSILAICVFGGAAMSGLFALLDRFPAFDGGGFFLPIGMTFFIAFTLAMHLLQNVRIDPIWKFFLPLLLTPVAMVLFVPVCIASGIATMNTVGARGYGPNFLALSIAIIFSFTLCVLAIASAIRRRYQQIAQERSQNQQVEGNSS